MFCETTTSDATRNSARVIFFFGRNKKTARARARVRVRRNVGFRAESSSRENRRTSINEEETLFHRRILDGDENKTEASRIMYKIMLKKKFLFCIKHIKSITYILRTAPSSTTGAKRHLKIFLRRRSNFEEDDGAFVLKQHATTRTNRFFEERERENDYPR